MNNTITNKIKHFPELFVLGKEIWRWHYFLFWSTIIINLDIYVYKYKDDYICEGLLQGISLITINIWLNFLLEINPTSASDFDVIY